jgi:hypothetical protein
VCRRWIVGGLLLSLGLLGLTGCRPAEGGHALDEGDPLHETGIGLPPEELGLPPRVAQIGRGEFEPVVAPPPFSEGIFPCSRCHVGGEPVTDTRPAQPHRTHLDNGLDCTDCHNQGSEEPVVPSPDMCFLCHGEPDDESEPARDYFLSIATEDGGYAFPRRWQTGDVQANHAGHEAAGVSCEQCHGEATNEPFTKPKSLVLMQSCTDCHEQRGVTTDCAACHAEIREPTHSNIVLKHSPTMTGCYQCHNPDDRDTLRLASGLAIPFERSYELCGQCHGPKLRDWKEGLHGKRVGSWDGKRRYLLCVHCHQNPHQPSVPPMEPMAPPIRPEDIR